MTASTEVTAGLDQVDRNERDIRAALETLRAARLAARLLYPGDVILVPAEFGDRGAKGGHTRHTVTAVRPSRQERDWVEVETDLTTYRCHKDNTSALLIKAGR